MKRLTKALDGGLVPLTLHFCTCVLCAEGLRWEGQSRPLFDSPAGTYNYAPCVIEEEDVHHVWWCRNEVPFAVHDAIWYRQVRRCTGTSGAAEREAFPARVALGRGAGGWDSYHVCDPSVVRGRFAGDSVVYSHALFYLGTDREDCKNNRIGVAFACRITGPWTRHEGNPIASGLADLWGVGQPSAISVDCGGRLVLLYTESTRRGPRVVRRELDLSDLGRPVLGGPQIVPTAGICGRGGGAPVFHNADFAQDVRRDEVVVVRPVHPFDGEQPDFVSTLLEVACIGSEALASGAGRWRVLGRIAPGDSGYARNHNAAITRDAFGRVPHPDLLRVSFSVGQTGPGWLWSYRLHGILGRRE